MYSLKKFINKLLANAGYLLVRKPHPDLPFIHQLVFDDIQFPFWITDDHTNSWWNKKKQDDSAEIDFLRQVCRPDSTVFDVGAHHGYQTVVMGLLSKDGHVHAFEANPICALTLQANLGLNKLSRVFPNLLAVGAGPGVVDIKGQSIDADSLNNWRIKMTSLDQYCMDQNITRVDVLKIDVEGYEGEVLKGASGLLETNPHINLELHLDDIHRFGWQAKDIIKLLPLDNEDYEVFLIDRKFSWIERKKISPMDIENYAGVINIFFINQAKM